MKKICKKAKAKEVETKREESSVDLNRAIKILQGKKA